MQKARHAPGEKKLGYAGPCKLLTEWRNSADTRWLAEAPVHPLQEAMSRNGQKAKARGQRIHARRDCLHPILNKSILEQGWYEFRRQLAYKLAWRGNCLAAVPPQNTSRTCRSCGHVSADNRQTQARFACVACGANPGGGRKQEPAEATLWEQSRESTYNFKSYGMSDSHAGYRPIYFVFFYEST